MFADTSKAYAVSQSPRRQTADPWPSYAETMDAARRAFNATLRPARFGQLAHDWNHYAVPGLYCRLSDQKLLVRRKDDSAVLPAWNVYDRPARRVPRKKGRFERLLDKLIDWRTGVNRVRQDWHTFQRAPLRGLDVQPEPEEVWASQERWAR